MLSCELGRARARARGCLRELLHASLKRVEALLLLGDLRALDHEVRAESRGDEQAGANPDEHRCARERDSVLRVILREEVDRTHCLSVLDSQTDCNRQRADLLRLADLLRDLHARERIADPDTDADQLLELRGQTRQMRGPASQDDLADTDRSRLVLVELKRGHELTREREERGAGV